MRTRTSKVSGCANGPELAKNNPNFTKISRCRPTAGSRRRDPPVAAPAKQVTAETATNDGAGADEDAGTVVGSMGALAVSDTFTRRRVELYAEYEAQCQREAVVDFPELLLRTYELLSRNEPLRQHYQRRFRHILTESAPRQLVIVKHRARVTGLLQIIRTGQGGRAGPHNGHTFVL